MSKELKEVLSTTREIELGGKTYTIGKITLGDISAFQSWCDEKKQEKVINLYNLAKKEINIIEIMSITGSQEDYDQIMSTISGVLFLLQRLLKKHNKEFNLTIEELSNEIGNDEIEKILSAITDVNVDSSEDSKEDIEKNVEAESTEIK